MPKDPLQDLKRSHPDPLVPVHVPGQCHPKVAPGTFLSKKYFYEPNVFWKNGNIASDGRPTFPSFFTQMSSREELPIAITQINVQWISIGCPTFGNCCTKICGPLLMSN